MNIQRPERASCRHLTHKHAAYLGCSLGEVCLIVSGYFLLDLVLSIVISCFMGAFFLIMISMFLLSMGLIRITARMLGHLKENKQQNYVLISMRHWLHKKFDYSIPQVTRTGRWSTRRGIL